MGAGRGQRQLRTRLLAYKRSGEIETFHLGPHSPTLTLDDLDLIHHLWLDAVGAVGLDIHHRDIVRVALEELGDDLKSGRRPRALSRLKEQANRPPGTSAARPGGPGRARRTREPCNAMSVVLGSSRLFDSGALKGRRIGVVANPASIDGAFRHVVDRAASSSDVTLAAVFGPQHGFRADLQDNMIESPHARDARRRVPVYSLYSETREPTADMLAGLDALVIDLQDVGARIYTFVYTMANCLRAAAQTRRAGVRLRPAEPDRRRGGRRADARAGLRVVRRACSPSRCGTG